MDIKNYFNPWYYYLNEELIKKKKPIKPGEFVHLHTYDGCFMVYDVGLTHFTVIKNRRYVNIPWSDFRCKKGDGNSDKTNIKRSIKNIDNIKLELDNLKFNLLNLVNQN